MGYARLVGITTSTLVPFGTSPTPFKNVKVTVLPVEDHSTM